MEKARHEDKEENMGKGYQIKCNKCSYEFEALLGIGMRFPSEYAGTVEAIRNGDYGKRIQDLFRSHNNAVVNCEREIAVCTRCNCLKVLPNMSAYLPKDGCAEAPAYVMANDLEGYDKQFDYDHKCSCGGDMRIVDFPEDLMNGKLVCPECGEKLSFDPKNMILWD